MLPRFLLGLLLFVSMRSLVAGDHERLVVHEWGTFTTLQNDEGQELYGINIDDEPVPLFVHNLEPLILNTPVLSHDNWLGRQKGAPRHHPQVSMRLETPVIYFYPPANAPLPLQVDVNVKFRGGWLTEFYPNADVRLPEAEGERFNFGELSRSTVGELTWRQLQVGTQGTGPSTDEHVWLAPRRVGAATVTMSNGPRQALFYRGFPQEPRSGSPESEKYLFYRGVANRRSPLSVSTINDGQDLAIRANFQEVLKSDETLRIEPLWLMEARQDGTTAFRRLSPITVSGDTKSIVMRAPRRFSGEEFSKEHRAELEKQLHEALVKDGLYADEATALLSTWQRAYFTSAGLRLFYLVPRAWTDHYLPLSISGNPDTERVMVGRIELISDYQRNALQKLAKVSNINSQWLNELDRSSPARRKLMAGRSSFGDLGVEIPSHFQLYLDLGRFRNALIAAKETQQGGSNNFTRFIEEYQLHPFRAVER